MVDKVDVIDDKAVREAEAAAFGQTVVEAEAVGSAAEAAAATAAGAAPKPAGGDADEPAAETEGASESELRSRLSLIDQARADIGERFAQRRAAEIAQAGGDPEPAADPAPAPAPAPAAETPASQPAAAPRLTGIDQSAADPASPEPTMRLKVNGVETDVPVSEVQRIAQESLAAGLSLRQAKDVLAEARASAAANAAATDQRSDPARRDTSVDPAQLLTVVEALQVGTPEDAAKALADLVARVKAPAEIPVEAVRTAVAEEKNQAEVAQAMAKFTADFRHVVSDEDGAQLVVNETLRQILSDLKAIGVPEKDIAAARANPHVAFDNYRRLRREVDPSTGAPYKIRGYQDILTAAGTAVAEKLHLAAPTGALPSHQGAETGRVIVSPERAARKQAISPQPRSGLPAPTSRLSGASTAPTRQSGSSIVDDMRRSRGFVR